MPEAMEGNFFSYPCSAQPLVKKLIIIGTVFQAFKYSVSRLLAFTKQAESLFRNRLYFNSFGFQLILLVQSCCLSRLASIRLLNWALYKVVLFLLAVYLTKVTFFIQMIFFSDSLLSV